jgi:DNA-binding response OmpR family regulator
MIARVAFPEELALSNIEAPLASLLVTRERVAASVAFSVLYGDRARQRQPQQASMRVHIYHLRRKFGRLDLRIDTIWGWGWKMPAADREKLLALLKEHA